MRLIKQVGSFNHPLTQEVYSMITSMMQANSRYKPRLSVLTYLVTYAFSDMEDFFNHSNPFVLLRAVIQRGVKSPEIHRAI